jgi:hypothetical protein
VLAHLAFLFLGLTPAPASSQEEEPPPRAVLGKFKIEEYGRERRLLYNDILLATQIHGTHWADDLVPLGPPSPWEAIAFAGAEKAWVPELEPLTYHHRSGPIGALFQHLRNRKVGFDASRRIGVLGLGNGAVACYAIPGQKVTFYETHPELKKLVAESDEHFTHLRAARKRGVSVDFRFGDTRKLLKDDKDRRYGVLIVETHDTGFDPGDRLTLEAIRLYMDRLDRDGIVAVHVSNKEYNLEPVVARIVTELNLGGRIWGDGSEGVPGKTSSTWVVIARDVQQLGVLAAFQADQVKAFGSRYLDLINLIRKYGADASAKDAIRKEWADVDLPLEEYTKRYGTERGAVLDQVRRLDFAGDPPTLRHMSWLMFGSLFRPLESDPAVGLRKDGDTELPRWPKEDEKE